MGWNYSRWSTSYNVRPSNAKQSPYLSVWEQWEGRHSRKASSTFFCSASIKLCMGDCCGSHWGIIYLPVTQKGKVKIQPSSHAILFKILK